MNCYRYREQAQTTNTHHVLFRKVVCRSRHGRWCCGFLAHHVSLGQSSPGRPIWCCSRCCCSTPPHRPRHRSFVRQLPWPCSGHFGAGSSRLLQEGVYLISVIIILSLLLDFKKQIFYRIKLDSGFAAIEALNASNTPGNGWQVSNENEVYWGDSICSFDLRTLSSAIFLLRPLSFKSLLSSVYLLIAAKYARCLGKQTETCAYSCIGQGTEYTGQRSGGTDDEMCVIVRNPEIKVSDESARKYLQEVISYQV